MTNGENEDQDLDRLKCYVESILHHRAVTNCSRYNLIVFINIITQIPMGSHFFQPFPTVLGTSSKVATTNVVLEPRFSHYELCLSKSWTGTSTIVVGDSHRVFCATIV